MSHTGTKRCANCFKLSLDIDEEVLASAIGFESDLLAECSECGYYEHTQRQVKYGKKVDK